jgi:hypothetical protein
VKRAGRYGVLPEGPLRARVTMIEAIGYCVWRNTLGAFNVLAKTRVRLSRKGIAIAYLASRAPMEMEFNCLI